MAPYLLRAGSECLQRRKDTHSSSSSSSSSNRKIILRKLLGLLITEVDSEKGEFEFGSECV